MRYWSATVTGMLLTVMPFALLLAVMVTLTADFTFWWSATVVGAAYLHALGSGAIAGWIHETYAKVPVIESGEQVRWWEPRLSPSQRAFMLSADVRVVPHRQWLQLVFPTVLLAFAVAGQLVSVRNVMVIVVGFVAFMIASLICFLMQLWPLHRRIYIERGKSRGGLLAVSVAMWSMYGLGWLAALSAPFICFRSSVPLSLAWVAGLMLGIALSLWIRPLASQPPDVEIATP